MPTPPLVNDETNKPENKSRTRSPQYYAPFSFPTNTDGTIITDSNEVLRQANFQEKIKHLEKLITAFGSQGIGCNHIHTSSHACTTQNTIDDEDQGRPICPDLEIEEPEDMAIQVGKVGEIITSLGGALAIGPVLDLLITLMAPQTAESPWFKPNPDIEVSPAMLLLSVALVIPAMYGAPHCHAQLEIASRTRNNFITQAKYAQKLLKWGLKNSLSIDDATLIMPKISVGDKEIAIDQFKLIDPSETSPLNFKQKLSIFGDWEQHFNEFVGLTVIAILRNIKNPIVQCVLISLCLLVAALACQPEVTTCANTLIFMNALENGQIIDDLKATNKANWQTTFSAVAKTPAVLYANFLSFQQICFGNAYAGLTLASLTTTGNITTQYFINRNTQTVGESQSQPKLLAQAIANTPTVIPEDNRKAWDKLSLLGKALVVTRAPGTGNERSEPITMTTITVTALAGASLSPTGQALLALFLCLAATTTAYSEARNAADHTARVRFLNKPLPVKSVNNNRLPDLKQGLLTTKENSSRRR